MKIAEKDLKLLWGNAAGRCSFTNCGVPLAPYLEKHGPVVIGEMAHVIGRKPGAARSSVEVGSDDTYPNLILLCPNHHTIIDKAEKDFTTDSLKKMKAEWEDHVASVFAKISDRASLFREVNSLLIENHETFNEWGPLSSRAQSFPQSFDAANYWALRKIEVIIPNNKAIIRAFKDNSHLLDVREMSLVAKFREHAVFYAKHCIDPADQSSYLPFPMDFAEMVRGVCVDGESQ